MNCILCSLESDLSLCAILSTKRRKNRVQQASKAIPLCGVCIRDPQVMQGSEICLTLSKTLQATYTALANRL
jgi:hypothetical protein